MTLILLLTIFSLKQRGHSKIHRERSYECDICHKKFLSKSLVSSHIEVISIFSIHSINSLIRFYFQWQIHFEREKSFQCQFCEVSFFRKNTLLRHIRNLHSLTPRKKYVCPNPLCNREYVRSNDLKNHKCRDAREPAAMPRKEKRIPERKFNCSLCTRRFFETSKLEIHFKRCHTESKRVKLIFCEKCKKQFRDPHKLVLHNKQNCSVKVMYDCDMCSSSFEGKRRLVHHFANYHKINALKTVPCNHCDKKFIDGSKLASHLRANANKLRAMSISYDCDYCRRLFQIKHHCIQHMERSCTFRNDVIENLTDGTDSQRFECEICKSAFKQKYGIVEHMKIMHSGTSFSGKHFMKKFTCFNNKAIIRQYPCCDEKYDGTKINQKHVNTAQCKFQCRKCRLVFADLYSLLRHCAQHTMKVHQSLRHMMQCKRCAKWLKWKSLIPEHMKSVNVK